jgi:hypothetical protein
MQKFPVPNVLFDQHVWVYPSASDRPWIKYLQGQIELRIKGVHLIQKYVV